MYWYNNVTVNANRHDLFLSQADMECGGKAIAGFYWNNGYMVSWTDIAGCKLPPISRDEGDESQVKHDIVKALVGFVMERAKYYDSLYHYLTT